MTQKHSKKKKKEKKRNQKRKRKRKKKTSYVCIYVGRELISNVGIDAFNI